MIDRLAAAARAHCHLRGTRVLSQENDRGLDQTKVRDLVERAAKAAGLDWTGARHLRHSICSHLAMRGVPAMTIRELAGHKDLATTVRYMHLSPAAIEEGIRLLEMPVPGRITGDTLETANPSESNSKGFSD